MRLILETWRYFICKPLHTPERQIHRIHDQMHWTPFSINVYRGSLSSFLFSLSPTLYIFLSLSYTYTNARNVSSSVTQKYIHARKFITSPVPCLNARPRGHPSSFVMTSSHGNALGITGPLWGDTIHSQQFASQRTRDAEFWCFLLP